MAHLLSLSRELGSAAEWSIVYIDEAHAVDEWPISSSRYNADRGPVSILQSHTLAARRAAAAAFARDFVGEANIQVCIDNPETGGTFQRIFTPWPVRFFVLVGDKVQFISEPPPGGNSTIEIRPFFDAIRIAAAPEFSSCR